MSAVDARLAEQMAASGEKDTLTRALADFNRAIELGPESAWRRAIDGIGNQTRCPFEAPGFPVFVQVKSGDTGSPDRAWPHLSA